MLNFTRTVNGRFQTAIAITDDDGTLVTRRTPATGWVDCQTFSTMERAVEWLTDLGYSFAVPTSAEIDAQTAPVGPTLWVVLLDGKYVSSWETAEYAQRFVTDELVTLRNDGATIDASTGHYVSYGYGTGTEHAYSVVEYAPIPF